MVRDDRVADLMSQRRGSCLFERGPAVEIQ